MASYVGAAIRDLLSGHLIQAGRIVSNGHTHYDFTIASWLWIGAVVLSCVMAQLVRLMPRRV